jgi:phosphoribosylamine--glycine ligase
MRILIIGSGGREHALGWQLARRGHDVIAAPGNPGLAKIGRSVKIGVANTSALFEAVERENIELVVVGPEAPLVAGIADQFRERGIPVFGPGADGARLEGSKAWAKDFFERHDIRSPRFVVCNDAVIARDAIAELGGALVIKADGLAAGKGVIVCEDRGQAFEAVTELTERVAGAASRIIVERRIEGREMSVMALCDGERIAVLDPAEDHKQLYDGDRGPNTGGMGAVSPVSWADAELRDRVRAEILEPTVAGLAADGIDYRGVLYAGVMVDDEETPWVLEYNCRFGDPETQPVLARMKSDLAPYLLGAANGKLPDRPLEFEGRAAVCVIMASRGYPREAQTGVEIGGLDKITSDDVVVFHAGTERKAGTVYSAGGRVLGVTALGDTTDQARERAYAAIDQIDFPGAHFRTDIGARHVGSPSNA